MKNTINFLYGWLGTVILLLCIGCFWQCFSPDAPLLQLLGIGIWCGFPIGILIVLLSKNV